MAKYIKNLMSAYIRAYIRNELSNLLNEEVESINLTCSTPQLIIDAIESLGGEMNEDWDSNGWQCDYWQTFTYGEQKYSISGCAYDGSCYISKK